MHLKEGTPKGAMHLDAKKPAVCRKLAVPKKPQGAMHLKVNNAVKVPCTLTRKSEHFLAKIQL
jgi:hypothetical protein